MRLERQQRQLGFSLVELMVTMVIGLFILAGVGSVYVMNKRSDQAREGLSLLQENGRIAIRLVEQSVMRAGYPMFEDIEPVIHADSQIERLNFDPEEETKTIKSVKDLGIQLSADELPSDVLTTIYDPTGEGGWGRQDCLGNKSKLIRRVINTFFVDQNSLRCRGSGDDSPQPLADNVYAMQVEYGVDSSGDGFADRYLPADDATNDDWQSVVSIRVALVVGSGAAVRKDPLEAPQTFNLYGQQVAVGTAGDRQLYQVFSTTIPLRNRMPLL